MGDKAVFCRSPHHLHIVLSCGKLISSTLHELRCTGLRWQCGAPHCHPTSPSSRCWKSKKFPYCDGSHAKHNTVTGDNVGPLIVKKSA